MGVIDSGIAALWNTLFSRKNPPGLVIGRLVKDGAISGRQVVIPHFRRSEHIAIIGKTGTGKSSLLRNFMSQDIAAGRGFLCIDLHGDLIPFSLSRLAEHERNTGQDLSNRLLLINPASPLHAVGLNLIENEEAQSRAVQISEIVAILRQRWALDHFGARTEELLRNSLWVLSENSLTLLEMPALLTNAAYRLLLLEKVSNEEVKAFFKDRYNRASDAMQTVMREAVLNKVTTFTLDPGIRHIVGQAHSTFSLRGALDRGCIILLDLRKALLGDNALTFAGLFLTKFKNSVFGRRARNIFSVYADELPNLVAAGAAFETLLSECRKFSVSVVSANQFLNQFSPAVRSALVSVGTLLCFRLSTEDAPFMAKALDGERGLIRRLITLPHRHLIGKFGDVAEEIFVSKNEITKAPVTSLVHRSLSLFAKPRQQIEDEINARKPGQANKIILEDWD